MMEKHPGGLEMTRHLLELADLKPCRILDMGAGKGQAVELLLTLGFDAVGIDLSIESEQEGIAMIQGDFLNTPFAMESFDAVLSECAFYVSGNPKEALKEAARLLKKGGKLLLADVSFVDEKDYRQQMESAGFSILYIEDITSVWKEYYLRCIWDGTVDEACAGIQKKGKCNYYLTICERV